MPRLISKEELESIRVEEPMEKAFSMNSKKFEVKNTKILIVGTITPPKGNGYYYTSLANRIYGYLDEAFNETHLKDLKHTLAQLPEEEKDKFIEDNIIPDLNKINVRFLDVMDEAIRDSRSPSDSKIKYYCLDTKSFENLDKNITIIVNSRLAESSFNQIKEVIPSLTNRVIYFSQRSGKKEDFIKLVRDIRSK